MRHGIFSLKLDGVEIQGKGEFTLNPGVPKNTAIMATNSKVAGTASEPQPPTIKGAMTIQDDTDIALIAQTKDATFMVQFDDGQTWILTNATYMEDGDLKTNEGEFQLGFYGTNLTELI